MAFVNHDNIRELVEFWLPGGLYRTCCNSRQIFVVFSERELVLELDRAKYSHRNGLVKKKTKGPNPTEKFIKGLEEERDYWKSEVDTLQKLLTTSRSRATSRSRSQSPTRASRSVQSTPSKSPSRIRSRNSSPVNSPTKNKVI